jgi:hypothetical protein
MCIQLGFLLLMKLCHLQAEAAQHNEDCSSAQQLGTCLYIIDLFTRLLTLLEVAKKQMRASPNVQPHVMCSTPMQNAATAPLADKLRFFSPWLHMPVANTRDDPKRSKIKLFMLSLLVRGGCDQSAAAECMLCLLDAHHV